ncbi:MAG: alcohol dehydrogenase catalytic domain-containing protein [Chloroflexi bacterium]|nr:alcohol dehydrogenase catalytic domain-containing protein [Chloroflexota bacterium]
MSARSGARSEERLPAATPATMPAAFNAGPGQFELRQVAVPRPAPDEALVRVRASGICGSDKHEFQRERPPRIAGHEFAGTIAGFGSACAAAGGLRQGDAVVVAPLVGCGACPACRRGEFADCEGDRGVRGTIGYSRPGAFAAYAAVPVRNLLPMSPALSFEEASVVEPAAVGLHAASRAGLQGQRCLVVGAGAIGLLVAQAATVRGAAEVWVADTDPRHLEVAASLGLRPLQVGRDAAPAGELDVAFECVGGNDAPLATAVDALHKYGVLVLVGSGHPGGLSTRTVVSRHLTVHGSTGTAMAELREAQELVAAGRIRVQPLISGVFPVGQITEAFAASLSAQKVIVEP